MNGFRFKIGDRVRLNPLEGTVDFVATDGTVNINLGTTTRGKHRGFVAVAARNVALVHRVVLPQFPGAVIRHAGCYLVLSTAGTWGCPDHGDAAMKGILDFEVIFEGVVPTFEVKSP